MVKIPSKTSYIRIQIWMTSKFNGDFLVLRYISGKIFMKIRTVVLREVANRQINKQTPDKT